MLLLPGPFCPVHEGCDLLKTELYPLCFVIGDGRTRSAVRAIRSGAIAFRAEHDDDRIQFFLNAPPKVVTKRATGKTNSACFTNW